MSYERMEIAIDCRTEYGGDRCNVIIPAYCHGPLAIHQDRECPDKYTLTHMQSGWAIKDGLSLHNAHRMLQRALSLDFDWTQDANSISALPKEYRMSIGRSLIEAIV